MAAPSIGIVIPAYNEEASIADLLHALAAALPQARLMVVDDSANEATRHAVEGANLPQVRVIRRASKQGRGSAVIEGMRALLDQGCDILVEMDADFSHNPAEIPGHLALLQQRQLDLLIGSRYMRGGQIRNWPLTRRVFSLGANRVARLLLRVPVSDYTNGFRFYSREAAEYVVANCGRRFTGFITLSEVLLALYDQGFALGETPTVFVNRVRGESSVTWKEIWYSMQGLVYLWLHCRLRLFQP